MKRILPLFLFFVLLLSGCGEVPLEEQNVSFPFLSHGAPGETPAPLPLSVGSSAEEALGANPSGDWGSAVCYGVSGLAAYETVNGALFALTFVTVPGSEPAPGDLDTLLAGLTADYGKPSASDKTMGVYQWFRKELGVTVTLTSHLTEAPAYASFTVVGNWEILCHLGLTFPTDAPGFPLLTNLLAEFTPLTVSHVTETWGEPTKDEDLGDGKRVLTYEDDAFDSTLGQEIGNLYFSFYHDKLYSAGVAFLPQPEDNAALFWDLYSRFTSLYGARGSEYLLGYAVERDDQSETVPAQTQYSVWQKKENAFALELVRSHSPEKSSVQFSITANWVLKDEQALNSLTASVSPQP